MIISKQVQLLIDKANHHHNEIIRLERKSLSDGIATGKDLASLRASKPEFDFWQDIKATGLTKRQATFYLKLYECQNEVIEMSNLQEAIEYIKSVEAYKRRLTTKKNAERAGAKRGIL